MSTILAATRPMRRDMFKAPWRLLAAVLLVALPVGLVVGTAIDSYSRSAASHNVYEMNTMSYAGGTCWQDVSGFNSGCDNTNAPAPEDLLAYANSSLPEGLEAQVHFADMAQLSNGSRATRTEVIELGPEAFPQGIQEVPNNNQIVLSSTTAQELDAALGDTVDVGVGDKTVSLDVSAISPGYNTLVSTGTVYPTSAMNNLAAAQDERLRWIITGDRPVTWDDVQHLNAAGFRVYSPDVAANPPSEDQLAPEVRDNMGAFDSVGNDVLESIVVLAIYGIMLILLLLFISPVFTLALSRHTQMFALMASQGASRRHIALAVLSYGLFAGVLGASIGVLGGLAIGSGLWIAFNPGWTLIIPFKVTLAAYVAAIVGSLVVASLPAYVAAKSSLASSIAGASPDRVVSWRRWMAIGPVALVVIAVGWLILRFLWKQDLLTSFQFQAPAAFLTLLATAASAPAALFLVSVLATKGPLVIRMAGRGILRQSMRSVPIVAALAGITFILSMTMLADSARYRMSVEEQAVFHPLPLAVVSADESQFTSEGAARDAVDSMVQRLRESQEVKNVYELRGVTQGDAYDFAAPTPPPPFELNLFSECEVSGPDGIIDATRYTAFGQDARKDSAAAEECLTSMRSLYDSSALTYNNAYAFLIDNTKDLDYWTFESQEDRDAAEATLAQGGIVLGKGTGLHGESTVDVKAEKDATLPAVEALPAGSAAPLFSQQAFDSLGLETTYIGDVVEFAHDDPQALRKLNDELMDDNPAVNVSLGAAGWYTSQWLHSGALGVVALVAMLLVIALSAPSIRRDNAALVALGASPRTAAAIGATQAAMLAATGLLLGSVVGLTAVILGAPTNQFNINGDLLALGTLSQIRPSWELALVILGVTAFSAAIAWVAHRPSSIGRRNSFGEDGTFAASQERGALVS